MFKHRNLSPKACAENLFFGLSVASMLLVASLSVGPALATSADAIARSEAGGVARDASHIDIVMPAFLPERSPTEAWPFESKHASGPAPGTARPDRLSAPEGWTYSAD